MPKSLYLTCYRFVRLVTRSIVSALLPVTEESYGITWVCDAAHSVYTYYYPALWGNTAILFTNAISQWLQAKNTWTRPVLFLFCLWLSLSSHTTLHRMQLLSLSWRKGLGMKDTLSYGFTAVIFSFIFLSIFFLSCSLSTLFEYILELRLQM